MEEMHDVIIGMHALNAVRAEIENRQTKRRQIEAQMLAVLAEIDALRVAEQIIVKAKGYNVALPKEN